MLVLYEYDDSGAPNRKRDPIDCAPRAFAIAFGIAYARVRPELNAIGWRFADAEQAKGERMRSFPAR